MLGVSFRVRSKFCPSFHFHASSEGVFALLTVSESPGRGEVLHGAGHDVRSIVYLHKAYIRVKEQKIVYLHD